MRRRRVAPAIAVDASDRSCVERRFVWSVLALVPLGRSSRPARCTALMGIFECAGTATTASGPHTASAPRPAARADCPAPASRSTRTCPRTVTVTTSPGLTVWLGLSTRCAIDPHLAVGDQRRRLGARFDHADEPQPLVEPLASVAASTAAASSVVIVVRLVQMPSSAPPTDQDEPCVVSPARPSAR